MTGDKMVDVAAEIRTGHLLNTSTEHYRVERQSNSTKNISLRVQNWTRNLSKTRTKLHPLRREVRCLNLFANRKILQALLEMNAGSSVHSQRLYELFQ